MSYPRRIQLQRTRGWRKPDGAIVVARPSKWGNPFVIGEELTITRATYTAGRGYTGAVDFRSGDGGYLWEGYEATTITPAIAVDLHRAQLLDNLTDDDVDLDPVRAAVDELRGHDLACWCRLDAPCHADTLIVLANRPEPWTLPS